MSDVSDVSGLTFGELAAGLGLKGSTCHGWLCPVCHAPEGVVEIAGKLVGSCRSCGTRFDRFGYVMWLRGCSPDEALTLILKINREAMSPQPGSCTARSADAEPVDSASGAQTSGSAAERDPT